jgi:hypothetical protein
VRTLRPNNDPSLDLPRPSHYANHSLAPDDAGSGEGTGCPQGRPPANTDEAITASTEDQPQGDRDTATSVTSTKLARRQPRIGQCSPTTSALFVAGIGTGEKARWRYGGCHRHNEVGLPLMKRWMTIEVGVLAVGCGRGQTGGGAKGVPGCGGEGAGGAAGWRFAAAGGIAPVDVGRVGAWDVGAQTPCAVHRRALR